METLTKGFYFVVKLASRIVPTHDIRVPRWCLGTFEGSVLDAVPRAKLVARAGHLIFVGLSGPGSRDTLPES
jgi:hypothetical protein